jgi:two-component system response regulator
MAKRLVLIEDDAVDVKLISDVVAQTCPDCRLEVFRDGANALSFFARYGMAEKSPLTLVLLDLTLPMLSGIQLLQEIKSRDATRTLPVVVFTGTASPEQINEAYRLGANSVIEKMNSREEGMALLRRTLDYWLNNNLTSEAQRQGS